MRFESSWDRTLPDTLGKAHAWQIWSATFFLHSPPLPLGSLDFRVFIGKLIKPSSVLFPWKNISSTLEGLQWGGCRKLFLEFGLHFLGVIFMWHKMFPDSKSVHQSDNYCRYLAQCRGLGGVVALFHFILITVLLNLKHLSHSHFLDEETKALKRYKTCPESTSWFQGLCLAMGWSLAIKLLKKAWEREWGWGGAEVRKRGFYSKQVQILTSRAHPVALLVFSQLEISSSQINEEDKTLQAIFYWHWKRSEWAPTLARESDAAWRIWLWQPSQLCYKNPKTGNLGRGRKKGNWLVGPKKPRKVASGAPVCVRSRHCGSSTLFIHSFRRAFIS